MCNCAVYIRIGDKDPRYVFIDHCNASPNANHKFQYFDRSLSNELKSDDLPLLDCNYTINNDNSDSEWKAVKKTNSYFQCARINSSTCEESYVLKSTFSSKSIKVKVDVKCGAKYGLSRIEINPIADLNYKTSGLCGNTVYDNELDCSLHIELVSTLLLCLDASNQLGHSWM